MIVQRDTYFRVAAGRLKLREEEPGEAHLIAYSRPDDADVRVSSYRVVPGGRRHARRADARRSASTSWSRSGGTCCCGRRVRIHLDEVTGLGSFVELEAVAEPDSDLARERAQVDAPPRGAAASRGALARGLRTPTAVRPACGSTRSCCGSRARPPAGPTRRTRTSPSAPPCAPTTAAATRARTSRTPRTRRASARRRRRSARWWPAAAGGWSRSSSPRRARQECAPCGGCRQRLREFAGPDAPIHLADLERVRRTTSARRAAAAVLRTGEPRMSAPPAPPRAIQARAPGFTPRVGLVLGSGLGALVDELADAGPRSPTPTSPASASAPSPATPARSRSARSTARRSPASRAARTSTRGSRRAR